MNLEARLKEATQEPILTELKGAEGLFAVTPSELIFISPEGIQRAPLKEIRRVASAKGGRLVIAGKEKTFIEASVAGFDVNELKLFFESVKGYVTKARRGELAPPPPPAPPEEETFASVPTQETPPVVPEEEPPPAPPPPPEPEPAARPMRVVEPEPAPAVEETPPARSPLRLPLKLLALVTWGYTGALAYLFPGLDPLWLGALLLGGLGLGLVEWRVADL